VERALQLGKRERLEEMGDRLEPPGSGGGRLDAEADDRDVRAGGPDRERTLHRCGIRRLDEQRLDVPRAVQLCAGLPSEAYDDEPEEVAHLGIRLTDHNLPHRSHFPAQAAGFWYGNRMKRARILFVDDDADIRGLLRQLLERAGYDLVEASNGKDGLRAFYSSAPDLVLLDVSMPEMDGWQTLERIRDLSDVPVLMLTARTAELERVRGLKAGADDYVAKPFGRQELLARVEALLRRAGPRQEEETTYADGLVTIDFPQRAVTVAGEPVALTPLEFKLLAVLVRHPNQVLSHDQLLELVWGDGGGGARARGALHVVELRQ
jgi:DNA-binding response OmpR family regulator